MKQTIYLKSGWNLISFLFKIDINMLYNNKNILEIKSLNESYNKIIPKDFNTLKIIDLSQGYYIKSKIEQSIILEGDYIDKVEYSLNEGWNLIGYPFDFEFKLENLDEKISEIKSIDKSYNSKLPLFSTLKV